MLGDILAVGNVEEVAVWPLRSHGFGGEAGIFNWSGCYRQQPRVKVTVMHM